MRACRVVLQQSPVGRAPLEEAAARVCVLMHVGDAQARTRLLERQRVCPAAHRGRLYPAQDVSAVPQVRRRVLGP
jgi:hypothetical protein